MSECKIDEDLEKAFEERADYLSLEQIEKWSTDSNYSNDIVKKLLQVGAKLIAGPRGTGKTHYMRTAYNISKNDNKAPLGIYISFNHYLRLEKFLYEKTNAINIFHSWVLAKILYELICEYNINLKEEHSSINKEFLKDFISRVEKQQYDDSFNEILVLLNVSMVQEYILLATYNMDRKRAILLFDDAALTLNNDYMIEFFDIFRSLKSSHISPKASIYPGTTQFGPRFHIGQDAERIVIWQDVQKPEYLDFMKDLHKKRFSKITIDENIDSLLIYASFGIPRAYLNLLRSYLDERKKGGNDQSIFNKLLDDQCLYSLQEYRSIGKKLPQYNDFIEKGELIFNSILDELKKVNHAEWDSVGKENFSRRVVYAFEDLDQDDPTSIRILNFLEEAGLLYRLASVSHGPERKLKRLIPHYSFILKNRILVKDRGFDKEWLVRKLVEKPTKKQPVRKKFFNILKEIGTPILSLPPCQSCQATRLSTSQNYCHQCGSKLVNQSTFDICMTYPLMELPLTKFQKDVLANSSFKTVGDVIITPDLGKKLREQPRVGVVRSSHINNIIETWVNEFLV